ncbi:NTP transferase domain-containing protein [Blastopirellula sp. JC732]|uniref:NTP transferase domain-containing protein n=1 Tax=Blastopirellula sediminis TaxID=2894196 RepID=A0A9X1MIN3_9BACT|nr:NTP transferase domain-containing protein [Blastopirellula sediminis]MCC9609360.1 NTP transferase domain-containing protein [Blastopirellula sediminis]MCC9627863.1 NTP transferase domain-containing protein [Blastopirellula sediminis]
MPSRLAQRMIGGKPLIEWLIRRLGEAHVDGVMVVLPEDADTNALLPLIPSDTPVHISRKQDSLGRLADAIREYQPRGVVRIPVENPFVDPALIDRLLTNAAMFEKCDYVAYRCENGSAAAASPVGLFAEWYRAKAILKADEIVEDASERENVSAAIAAQPDWFPQHLLPVPSQLEGADVRLSVIDEEDWENALVIVDAMRCHDLAWQDVVRFIRETPHLRQRMETMNQVG